jgi:hypothetical protein
MRGDRGLPSGADLETYRTSPVIRSAVERQLILIGEAVGSLLHLEPGLSQRISDAQFEQTGRPGTLRSRRGQLNCPTLGRAKGA